MTLTNEQSAIVEQYQAIQNEMHQSICDFENRLDNLCEEYVNYKEHYSQYYDDDPASIKNWFEAINEFDILMERWNELSREHSSSCDGSCCLCGFLKFDNENDLKFRRLERVLGI